MRRVGGEDRVRRELREGPVDIEFDRFDSPQPDAGKVLGDVACLPGEMRQLGREVCRVLAGARADFQDRAAIAEDALQDREDRPAVPFAGFGERL